MNPKKFLILMSFLGGGSSFAIVGNTNYHFSVTSGKTAHVIAGTNKKSALTFGVGTTGVLNIADISPTSATTAPNPGALLTPNASGTSLINTKTCASSISWLPALSSEGVLTGGTFSAFESTTGAEVGLAVNCGGSCGCAIKTSVAYTSPQTNPTFTSSLTTPGTVSITAATTGTNYAYFQMEQQCGTILTVSSNIHQVAFTGVLGGSYTDSNLSTCF